MSVRTSSRRGRWARLALTILMTMAWTGVPAWAAQAVAAGNSERSQKQIAAVLLKLSKIAQRELAKPDADPSDVKAKAMQLGADVERIFAFVRDEVRYEPYRGVLRGAEGALLARSGNAYDKSLLLQSMLEAHGISARLVRGELLAEKAAALVDAFLKADALVGPLADAVKELEKTSVDAADAELVKTIAAESGLDADAVMQAINGEQTRAAAVTAQAWATVDREAPALLKRLDAAGVKLGQPADATVQELRSRAARHVWVEVQDPADAGKWVALDPSVAGSARGTAHAAGQPLELKPEDEHTVTIKLIYTTKGASGPEPTELINAPIPTRQAAVNFPELTINPAEELPSTAAMAAMKEPELVRTLAAIKKFQPSLRVGSQSAHGKVFDLKGNLFSVSADGRVKGASEIGAAAGGLFGGGALGGGGDAKADDNGPGKFLELSVVIEIAEPGEKPVPQKRVLLTAENVVGEHRQSPMISWNMLVQPQPIGSKWASNRSLKTLITAMEPTMRAFGATTPKELEGLVVGRTEPHSGVLLLTALMRERAIARQLRDAKDLTVLWDGPLVAIAERSFCMNPKAGHACGTAKIDLVDNTIRFVGRAPGAEAAAATAALRQGVFDTAAEALALRETQRTTPGAPEQIDVRSPIDDLARARAAGDQLGVVTMASGAAPAGLALAEPDKAWVAQFERPGQVIVAPTKAVAEEPAPGWWSVDPVTGSVVGRAIGGRGVSSTEYALMAKLVGFVGCFVGPAIDAGQGKVKTGAKITVKMIGCIIGGVIGLGAGGAAAGFVWAVLAVALQGADKVLPD